MDPPAQQAPRGDRIKLKYLQPKIRYINYVSAACHLITGIATCVSLGGLTWFHFDGDICVPSLSLAQFFWFECAPGGFGYTDSDCLSSTLIYSIRAIILLCFMIVISSLLGFWIDIIQYRNLVYHRIRNSPLTKLCSLAFILIIIGLCCILQACGKRLILNEDAKTDFHLEFGTGFHLLAYLGGMLGTVSVVHIIEVKLHHRWEKKQRFTDIFDAVRLYCVIKSHKIPTRPPGLYSLAAIGGYPS